MSGGVLVTGRVVSAFRSSLRDGGTALCVIVRPDQRRPGKVHALIPIDGWGSRMQNMVVADTMVQRVHEHQVLQLRGSSLESWFDHGVDVRLLDPFLMDATGVPLAWPEMVEVAA
jgi:hypothetical protein